MVFDCIVLTDKRYLKDATDPYKHNVFYEDTLVLDALKSQGLRVGRKAWDDTTFNWADTRSVLFRTTWDYFDRFEEFSKWLTLVSKQTQLFNSEKLIRWNLDKHYLKDLSDKGVHIPETLFIETGSKKTLKQLHQATGWTETVLKPCVSGAARHTYKLELEHLKEYESIFQQLITQEAFMLQVFQHNIVKQGEVSMMVFNGKFTHAILKKAKEGDFRVQDDFGGSVHNYAPNTDEIAFAEHAAQQCPELPLYARVDIFKDNEGRLAVSELELIEPELWFRHYPKAADLLAATVSEKLKQV